MVHILRLYYKQKVKDIYTVSQFFGLNIFSEKFLDFVLTSTKCRFFQYLIQMIIYFPITTLYTFASVPKCSFRTLQMHIEIDHKAVRLTLERR